MQEATLAFPHWVGRQVIASLGHVGRFSLMVAEILRGLAEVRIWLPRALTEAWNIGVGSLFIVLLISAFAGAVTALQAGYQFQGSLPMYVVGTLQAMEVIKELLEIGESLAGRILMYDALWARFFETKLSWTPDNPLTGRNPTIAAPTPMPANPSSAMGVSTIRLGPNSLSSPRLTLYAPSYSATSSPMRKTRSSRVSSSRSAWLRASR